MMRFIITLVCNARNSAVSTVNERNWHLRGKIIVISEVLKKKTCFLYHGQGGRFHFPVVVHKKWPRLKKNIHNIRARGEKASDENSPDLN